MKDGCVTAILVISFRYRISGYSWSRCMSVGCSWNVAPIRSPPSRSTWNTALSRGVRYVASCFSCSSVGMLRLPNRGYCTLVTITHRLAC